MPDQKSPRHKSAQRRARQRGASPQSIQHDVTVETITAPLANLALELVTMPQPLRLLVVSLGNPGRQYLNTLHSAGHQVLQSLVPFLPSNAPFTKSRQFANGMVSAGPVFTLWESPTYMNVSGPAVLSAWKAFLKENGHNPGLNSAEGLGLVVLHDELESPLGKLKIKEGKASASGHNGMKSIKGVFPGGLQYKRIGIGIGRPESREPQEVADYVLRKMSGQEKVKIEGTTGSVLKELEKIAGV